MSRLHVHLGRHEVGRRWAAGGQRVMLEGERERERKRGRGREKRLKVERSFVF